MDNTYESPTRITHCFQTTITTIYTYFITQSVQTFHNNNKQFLSYSKSEKTSTPSMHDPRKANLQNKNKKVSGRKRTRRISNKRRRRTRRRRRRKEKKNKERREE